MRCDAMGRVCDDVSFCAVLISSNKVTRRRVLVGRVPPRVARFGTAFICITILRHASRRSACLPRGLPVPSPVSTCASRRTRSTPSSTRCASLTLGAPGREGEYGDVSRRERGRKLHPRHTLVAPGTRRSRTGRCGSSSPRRKRRRTAVCRHASTRTPRGHLHGSCSSRAGRVRESETGVTTGV